MYAEERHQAIAALVADRGRLSVAELAGHFDVTTETVRRDLSALERAGLVRRVHGGAVPAQALSVLELAVNDRDRTRGPEKDRIARAALDLLPVGGCIALDAGTTTARLANLLPPEARLTVITHSVPIAARLAGTPGIALHILPGRVRATTRAAVGEETIASLSRLRFDVAFVGANGLSLRHGLSTPDHSEAAVKRALIASADRVVVLADSTKYDQEQLVRFADLDEVDTLVTDAQLGRADLVALEARGLEVVVA